MNAPENHRDPRPRLLRNSRREASIVLAIWLGFLIWVVGSSWLLGYRSDPPGESFRTIIGMPLWIFWGVALPWVVASLLTIAFGLLMATDDELGGPPGSAPENG